MSVTLEERIIVPVIIASIVAALSGGLIFILNAYTRSIKIVWICAIAFNVGLLNCIAWHDVIAKAFGWQRAWILLVCLIAAGTVYMGRFMMSKQAPGN